MKCFEEIVLFFDQQQVMHKPTVVTMDHGIFEVRIQQRKYCHVIYLVYVVVELIWQKTLFVA
jgi:hypothetical protein